MPTGVSVLVYVASPIDNYRSRHTALYFEFPDGTTSVMHVRGAHGIFEFEDNTDYRPDGDGALARKIPIANLPDSISAASIRRAVYATPLRNRTGDRDWNCQNWVGEALTQMLNSGYLDMSQREDAIDKMTDVCLEGTDDA